MALARIKTWNPGDVLTAADLNAEFNNPLNNPISLVSPTTGAINFNLQAHTNLLPSVISASSAGSGAVLVGTTAATPIMQGLAVGTSGQYLMVGTSGVPLWIQPLGRTVVHFSRGVNVTTSATVYTGLSLSSTTEATAPGFQIPYVNCVASRLFVNISSSGASTGTMTVFVRRDGVNTNLTLTISSSVVAASDVVNTATFSSTNVVTLSWAVTAGTTVAVGNATLVLQETT